MKKKLFVAALLLLIPLCAIEAKILKIKGAGDTGTREELIHGTNVSTVDIAVAGNVEIVSGNVLSVKITAYENQLEYIKAEAEGGLLKIFNEKNVSLTNSENSIMITVPGQIEKISREGSANVYVKTPVAPELFVESAGSGNINISGIENARLIIKSTGSGKITAKRNTVKLDIKQSGSGNIDCGDLECANADINKTGSGNIVININGPLLGKMMGSGKIYYKGSPMILGEFRDGMVVKL